MTLEERIAALEARSITVADLPIAALQRKLEQNWQPDGGVLLQKGSVPPDALTVVVPTLLSGAVKISEVRSSTVTMPVGANAVALNVAGLTAVGVLVASMVPATHNTWTWYPYSGGVVFVNSGASQNVTVGYYVVGT